MTENDEKEMTHPSYVMIGFNRWQGTPIRLFGSAIKTTQGISLEVRQATRQHKHNQDWYCGHKEILRIYMTEMQFAQLLSSTGTSGVPATLYSFNGESIKPEEVTQSEAELVHEAFKKSADDISKKLEGSVSEINNLVQNSKLSVKDKKAIMSAVARFEIECKSNIPFLLQQLRESAEKVIAQVKTEICAFASYMKIGSKETKEYTSIPLIEPKEK